MKGQNTQKGDQLQKRAENLSKLLPMNSIEAAAEITKQNRKVT
jgi:hypothetical protein